VSFLSVIIEKITSYFDELYLRNKKRNKINYSNLFLKEGLRRYDVQKVKLRCHYKNMTS